MSFHDVMSWLDAKTDDAGTGMRLKLRRDLLQITMKLAYAIGFPSFDAMLSTRVTATLGN